MTVNGYNIIKGLFFLLVFFSESKAQISVTSELDIFFYEDISSSSFVMIPNVSPVTLLTYNYRSYFIEAGYLYNYVGISINGGLNRSYYDQLLLGFGHKPAINEKSFFIVSIGGFGKFYDSSSNGILQGTRLGLHGNVGITTALKKSFSIGAGFRVFREFNTSNDVLLSTIGVYSRIEINIGELISKARRKSRRK